MGDAAGSDALVRQALPVLLEFPDDSRLQSRQHDVRGWLARIRGDLSDAQTHLLASLDSAIAAYGHKDNRVADAMRGLAEVAAESRDYSLARRYIEEARSTALVSPNATATDLVGIEIERARFEFDAGHLATAEPLMAAAITHCDSALGERNEDCFFARAIQARLWMQMGDFRRAQELLPAFAREANNDLSPRRRAEALIIASRVLAANEFAGDHDNLQGRLSEIIGPAVGEKLADGIVKSARLALAEVALRERRTADVDASLADLLTVSGSMSNESRAYFARALMLHGLALQVDDNHPGALIALRSAEENYAHSFGASHTEVLLCRLNQVPSLVATGAGSVATQLVDEALPALRATLPSNSPILTRVEKIRRALHLPMPGKSSTVGRAVFFKSGDIDEQDR